MNRFHSGVGYRRNLTVPHPVARPAPTACVPARLVNIVSFREHVAPAGVLAISAALGASIGEAQRLGGDLAVRGAKHRRVGLGGRRRRAPGARFRLHGFVRRVHRRKGSRRLHLLADAGERAKRASS